MVKIKSNGKELETGDELLELVGPRTEVKTISLERRTLACVWYLSNQETFRSIVDRFGLSKGSLHYFLRKFCNIITSNEILQQLIRWPSSDSEFQNISENFTQRAGFPNVIGALDGTYIPILGPTAFRESYICRKGFPALHLQAVCDTDLKFLDVFCAYPGSVHDSRVFKNSPLYTELQNNPVPRQYHLLGDSAYGNSETVLVPFRDNGHLNADEKRYNNAHSSTRVDIERSFGLLKGKFRRLRYVEMKRVEDIPSLVVTCCGLHNFIIQRERYTDEDIDMDAADGDGPPGTCSVARDTGAVDKSGHEKRLQVMHSLQ
ncbi:putative nuclease HARBI1 [Pecten maximus]|uniref:putative nuclease HARBI1 n=1 Tax=Pecten maximus TaxID=6579 RepID=UPI0014581081|nr:putative nuclease HARBI1 [Pecten maximus]